MRSNELRKLIRGRLTTAMGLADAKQVFYLRADSDALFPHLVFEFEIDNDDLTRHDYNVLVHVWTKNNEEQAQDLADAVENAFSIVNDPQDEILPTFFLVRTYPVDDPDKTISHKVVRLVAQTYERN